MIRIGGDRLQSHQDSSALGIVLSLSTLSGRDFEWDGYQLDSVGRQLVEGFKEITGAVYRLHKCLLFSSGQIQAGSYRLAFCGAESVTPVLLALTPLFAHARGASKLTLLGGTHVNAAQPAKHSCNVPMLLEVVIVELWVILQPYINKNLYQLK